MNYVITESDIKFLKRLCDRLRDMESMSAYVRLYLLIFFAMRQPEKTLCSFYPRQDEADICGGVCWAGSELGRSECTQIDEETCEHAKERKEAQRRHYE